uniref:Uncharacterized protein n=1 Tax=Salix viminalis TaxID=40686 RepID=A0A6N2M2E0_SALVM
MVEPHREELQVCDKDGKDKMRQNTPPSWDQSDDQPQYQNFHAEGLKSLLPVKLPSLLSLSAFSVIIAPTSIIDPSTQKDLNNVAICHLSSLTFSQPLSHFSPCCLEDLGKGKEGQREADGGQEQEVPTPLGNLNKEAKESRQSEPATSNKEPITTQPPAHIHDKAEGSTKLDEAQTGLRCKEKAKGIMEDQMGLGIESMLVSGHTSEGGAEAEASGCSTSAAQARGCSRLGGSLSA